MKKLKESTLLVVAHDTNRTVRAVVISKEAYSYVGVLVEDKLVLQYKINENTYSSPIQYGMPKNGSYHICTAIYFFVFCYWRSHILQYRHGGRIVILDVDFLTVCVVQSNNITK